LGATGDTPQAITKDSPVTLNGKQISLNILPVKDEEHKSIVVILDDVTERNRIEAKIQYAQRMESIGTLAAGIAHNFNNLLGGIMGNAELGILNIDTVHPNYQNLQNIKSLVLNGSRLTNQLIGYAREGQYEIRSINLNQLVEETSDTFGQTKKEIIIHQDLADNLHGIKADQGQIEQALLNLYVNALDAMPGGGDLFLKTMNVTHEDMTGKAYEPNPGNYVLLSIRDTGSGMDKKTIKRIFEPFFTTKGLASGTGLGLASTYGIIKGHGGYIDVHSEKEKGTTFEIYLPATEEGAREERGLSGDLVKGTETVLLVDDEKMITDVGEKILKCLGYNVYLANDGKEALEVYKENKENIDMVILDMVMPGIGGGETYDRMKKINPDINVLLSSGYSIDGEAKEILERGCNGFIHKPFRMNALSQKLRAILDS